jgi:DNA-binding transcriptional LysR family regulator
MNCCPATTGTRVCRLQQHVATTIGECRCAEVAMSRSTGAEFYTKEAPYDARMDLHQATYFLAIVDHGGITKASRALYISQPSLSQAMRSLERQLDVSLFDRSTRRLELTDAGRSLEGIARKILVDVDRLQRRVAAVKQLAVGRVDIVTYSAFAIDYLVGLIEAFRHDYPGITVSLIPVDGPAGVLAALRRGDAEVGITDLTTVDSPFRCLPVGSQELVLAVPNAIADTLPDPVPREIIRTLPLIMNGTDPSNAKLFADLVAPDGANIVIDCALSSARWGLVGEGCGVTVVPGTPGHHELSAISLRAIEPPLVSPFGLVTRHAGQSPAAQAFLTVAGRPHHGRT